MSPQATTTTAQPASALTDTDLATVSAGTFGLTGVLEKFRPKQTRS